MLNPHGQTATQINLAAVEQVEQLRRTAHLVVMEARLLEQKAILEGMKWENEQRKILDQSMAYTDGQFNEVAEKISEICGRLSHIYGMNL